jgi:hypothetical protein
MPGTARIFSIEMGQIINKPFQRNYQYKGR